MSKIVRVVSIAMLVLSVAPLLASPNGSIRLRVRDQNGAAIGDARVELGMVGRPGNRQAFTDVDGTATFVSLAAGTWEASIAHDGFATGIVRLALRQDETVDSTVVLQVGPVSEAVTVTRAAPVVETNTAALSAHLTLADVDRIPVGRDYVGYAQLVAGVSVVVNGGGVQTPADPSAKGGNNYTDRGGNPGSRDNVHLLDGFDITDIGGGIASLEVNSEVILEDHVTTSGIGAASRGAKGFVGNVVTKSGTNEYQASASFFAHDASWYSPWKTRSSVLRTVHDDQSDYALTLSGPIVRDKLTFFASAQRRETDGNIVLSTSASPEPKRSQYRFERTNLFAKVSAAPTTRDALTAMYFGDDRATTGAHDPNVPVNRYGRADDVLKMFAGDYQRVVGSALLAQLRASSLDRDASNSPSQPELGPSNTLLYPGGVIVPAYQRDLGSGGAYGTSAQQRVEVAPSVTWNFDAAGSHMLRSGVQLYDWFEENSGRLVDGVALTSLASSLSGATFSDVVAKNILPQGEFDYILRALNASQGSAAFAFADANRDGVVSAEELGAIRFSSANTGGINFLRARDLQVGKNKVRSRNRTAFLQDDWTFGRVNVQLGVRMDDWKYTASDGSTIVDMDPVFAPRFGVAWDPSGTGRQRVSFFYGRYYDPLLTPIVRFAGNLSGTVQAEEIFIGNGWFDYRQRGSATRRDAVFAPNLQNQRQDEYALTWGLNVTPVIGVTAQGYFRKDGNLIEDYDPVYFDRSAAGELALTPGQFGFGPAGPRDANYFVGNLVGAKRETWGLDMSLDRGFANDWNASLQYSYKNAKGNSNSDANTDLQGDFLNLDPRLPYMWGHLPGSIDHQVKTFGAWRSPFRLEVGGLAYWSSGAHYTEADIFRPASYNIIMNHKRSDGTYATTGAKTQPSYFMANARLRYPWTIGPLDAEVTLDIYNLFDNQGAFLVEEGHNHPQFKYGETRVVLEPRRWELGFRVRM